MAGQKRYYSISEIARMFDVSLPTLRYWEQEVDALEPKKNAKGTRFYTPKDVETVKQIVFLTSTEHLTLKGVNKKLSEQKDDVEKRQQLLEKLNNMRTRFVGMIEQIDKMNEANEA